MSRIAVIGRGLIGAAAARHLAKAGHEVLLIGPDEPQNISAHKGVFASHYDEGRITRKLDPNPFWSRVAAASINRYQEIEAESGISFFSEVGALMAAPVGSKDTHETQKLHEETTISSEILEGEELKRRLPFFNLAPDVRAFYEPKQAGYISPRNLVKAQTCAARNHGATVLNSEVLRVTEGAQVEIIIKDKMLQADQVLIAAGAFSNSLLTTPLDLTAYARTIAFFEIDREETTRLKSMPSLVYRLPDGRDPYLLPPILYPDGKTYLKLGGDPVDRILHSPDEIKAWFRAGGDQEVGKYLHDLIQQIMPGLRIKSWHIAACVTQFTAHGLPYIDRVSDKITIATGGCGTAAKSSDELGRLGAMAVLGQTDPHLKAIFKGS